MATVAGVQGLVVDGVAYTTAPEAKYDFSTETVESIPGARGRAGQKYVGAVPFIETKIFLGEGQTSETLRGARNINVQLRLADRVCTLSEASFVGGFETDGSDNSGTVRFEGASGVEVAV